MTTSSDSNRTPAHAAARSGTVLRLMVRNHPGVMSHVCGLFARRSFNLDGILCVPVDDGARSEMLLLVNDDARLAQLILQLHKLEDVIDVSLAPQMRSAFDSMAELLK